MCWRAVKQNQTKTKICWERAAILAFRLLTVSSGHLLESSCHLGFPLAYCLIWPSAGKLAVILAFHLLTVSSGHLLENRLTSWLSACLMSHLAICWESSCHLGYPLACLLFRLAICWKVAVILAFHLLTVSSCHLLENSCHLGFPLAYCLIWSSARK